MQRNIIRNITLSLGATFFLSGIMLMPETANAGFRWVAPPVHNSSPSVQTYPDAQIITNDNPSSTSVVTGDVSVIMSPEAMSVSPLSQQIPNKGIIQGFANDVPLSVALRQILPNNIGFSVAQDISLGTLVSWQGGAPWRDVLKNMLSSKNLTIKEDGNIVHVVHRENLNPVVRQARVRTNSVNVGYNPVSLSPSVNVATYAKPTTRIARPSYSPSTTVRDMGYLPVSTASVPMQRYSSQTWNAHKGQMLRAVLMDWGRRANVDISWQAEYDYPFQASISVMGSFEEVVRKLLSGFEDASPKPVGYLYNNQSAGQRVLVIQTRGNNYAD